MSSQKIMSKASMVREKYRVKISSFVLKQIKKSELSSSLRIARQFFPSKRELNDEPYYDIDPLNEEDHDIHPLPYLIHKYPSKLLLLTTDDCPVYCRYCTRKRKTMLREQSSPKKDQSKRINIKRLKKYIRGHPDINEVIFSGGDPFMLSDHKLFLLSEVVLAQKTILFLRYHTRAATTIPRRFSNDFFDFLVQLKNKHHSKFISFVFHINHPAEITEESSLIFYKLHKMGHPIFSQSVLLRKVNDHPKILGALYKKLIRNNIQPYYLHQLDAVEGSSHFHVPIEKGLQIMEELKKEIPPYMLPKYVRDSKQGKKMIVHSCD